MDYHKHRFFDASSIAVDGSNRIIALFPANRIGTRLYSHGGLSYGGMISGDSMTSGLALDLFNLWLDFCRAEEISEIFYKVVPSIYHRIPAEEDRYALFRCGAQLYRREVLSVVDLANPAPIQHRRQRGANKAAKLGLQVKESRDLEGFWPVLEANLADRYATRPVHSVGEIRLLADRFPENIRLLAVYDNDTICAGTLLYHAGTAIHAQYIAATPEARDSGALDYLFLSAIQQATGHVRYFDFGNSNEQDGQVLNRGLADFKEGFGARAICHDFYHLSVSAHA